MAAVSLAGESWWHSWGRTNYPGLVVQRSPSSVSLVGRSVMALRSSPAMLMVDVLPDPPPSDSVWITRRSQIWPAPVLGSDGMPTNWSEPTSEVVQNWGRFQVIVDGKDVTYFRGTPCTVELFGSGEPFDDDVASIFFPQITSLEPLPSWLSGEKSIVIRLIRPNGTKKVLWEGFIAADSDNTSSGSFGTRVEAYGALYDGDRFLTRPKLWDAGPQDIGHVIAHQIHPNNAPGIRLAPMARVTTGIKTNEDHAWMPRVSSRFAELLASATTDAGKQWTLMKSPGLKPVLRLKDTDTIHWTVRCGQPGVEHDLTRDMTTAPSVYFGEGVDNNNCRWRNAKYPRQLIDDPPVYPGVIYYPNAWYDNAFREFKNRLITVGYRLSDDTAYHAHEESEIRRFQASYGGAVTGIVAAQTWAAAFKPGSAPHDTTVNAYFEPIAGLNSHLHRITYPSGAVPNPNYNPRAVRREHYINWGSGISKAEATRSSKQMLERTRPADYVGTITLSADPQEGHRFEMRAGQNILFRNHHGVDRKFHIARAEIDPGSGTVTLDVDEAGRDALTLAEIKKRNTENATPTWKREVRYRNSRRTEDSLATWDCENGAGVIPRHGTFRKLWNVLQIPMSQGGDIVRTEFQLDIPARFAVGIWDRYVSHAFLASHGSPLDEGYWDQFGDGLIIAWGGAGQSAGYSPGRESEGDPLTGRLEDNSSWYYESQYAPWLWVAIWVESPQINYIRGRLYPGLF